MPVTCGSSTTWPFASSAGGALVITAKDARGPRALLLALAGRATLEGRARVGGHLLPGREAWVRAHVGVALLDGSAQPVRDLRRALGGRPRILVIDGLDALIPGSAHDQAAAALRDAASATPELTLVVASTHPDAARALLAEAGWPAAPVLDVTVLKGALLSASIAADRRPHDRGARMTLHIERARSRRPITWLTLIGVLLLPVLIGGILVAALYNPAERLDSMSAAIVNEDEPVTIDDQYVPLGRQLTAGLVEGSDDIASNLDWTISNADDAAAGLADGTYQAVVTIPSNFSAAATSTAPGGTPEQATIEVSTPPDSKVVDDAITAQVTSAAASIMGRQLSQVYLENVFLGFTTLGDQLGEAADGAHQLADGATQAADGATALAGGSAQLERRRIAARVGRGRSSAAGSTRSRRGIRSASSGATQLANGRQRRRRRARRERRRAAAGHATSRRQPRPPRPVRRRRLSAASRRRSARCRSSARRSRRLDRVLRQPRAPLRATPDRGGADGGGEPRQAAGGTSFALDQFDQPRPPRSSPAQFRTIASRRQRPRGRPRPARRRHRPVRRRSSRLGSPGATQLARRHRPGRRRVRPRSPTASHSSRAGTTTLADGLDQASTAVPSYSDDDATSLATVVADPVTTDGLGSSLFGASAVPLLATLALWFGGLGTFVALQAASRRALTSRAPSAVLALRGLAPAAALGAVQGLLVAGVVQLAASYDWGQWSLFAALCVIAGVAFAAVNQALVAVFGGAGRWLAALVGVLAVATGVVSTVPGVLSDAASLLPTAPAYNGMLAALTDAAGLGAGDRGAADLVGSRVRRDDDRGGAATRGELARPARGIPRSGVARTERRDPVGSSAAPSPKALR